jgi:hypothetical protein
MYTGMKMEGDYTPTAKAKVHSRGISAVRRDNALIVRDSVSACLDVLLSADATPASVAQWVADRICSVRAACADVYAHPDQLEQFVLSAGLSKDPSLYDVPRAASTAALQLMKLNPTVPVGSNARVTFVVVATRNEKRADQVVIPQIAAAEKPPLNVEYYVEALRKKLLPLVSVYFVEAERRKNTMRNVFGALVHVAPLRVADQKLLPGQMTATKRVGACLRAANETVKVGATELRTAHEKTVAAPAADPKPSLVVSEPTTESKTRMLTAKQWGKMLQPPKKKIKV